MTVDSEGAPLPERPAVLSFRGVEKRYPNGVYAVRGVDLDIVPGEIHSVVGENGAGKSTLMKLAYGLEMLTAGAILIDGRPVTIGRPLDAIASGIGMVHQHLELVGSLTVAENIALGIEPGSPVWVDRVRAVQQAQELAERFGLPVDARRRVAEASVGTRQRTAILKALGRGARVLILDEPTAVLAPQEAEQLFAAVRALRNEGVTVIFISHKLDEVREISDRITVMRQGEFVATHDVDDTTESSLAAEMVGREVSLAMPPGAPGPRREVLVVDSLRTAAWSDHLLTFEVGAGEIVGIAGIEDNGQSDLMNAIAGIAEPVGGRITLSGRDLTHASIRSRRNAGVAIVPEDRLHNGAALDLGIDLNLVVDRYDRPPLARRGVFSPARMRAVAQALMTQYRVKAPDPAVPMSALSGGNMQKVVMARELSSKPVLLLASQPTRGVDIGSMQYIYEQLIAARDAGSAVLLVSADLTELLNLSDRLLVMRNGRIVARFDDLSTVTKQAVGEHMIGVATAEDTERGLS